MCVVINLNIPMNKTTIIALIAVCLFSSGLSFWLNGVEIVSMPSTVND